MTDLISILPPESFTGCVECVKVCRRWSDAMLQCLGQQVESVYIKSQATYKVLERLAWRRYSIRFLANNYNLFSTVALACGLSDIHCWDVLARNQFTQLTSLGLTDITGMSSEDWSQILLMQQQNEILEVGIRAGITQYLNSIIATIGTLQRLRILSLRNFLHMFSENPLCDLTPLRRLQQLEKMRLTNIPIDNQGLMQLCEPSQHPLVRRLSLNPHITVQ
ncbi:hypothetical protein BDB00DRAFT_829548 [Zychaea mexicana]|uniref:uncharacterized protein n=1 Tax=Zychaea mexicana TaxID=64656 RepID=UPI0022FDD3D3|nr:uncharacterized protein BDB00DRAFT_829548 [Zychaea mexicana]KAI9492179.1 hypothetical protein BDB00DRAFT_829548 [Zychaea mexicana]